VRRNVSGCRRRPADFDQRIHLVRSLRSAQTERSLPADPVGFVLVVELRTSPSTSTAYTRLGITVARELRPGPVCPYLLQALERVARGLNREQASSSLRGAKIPLPGPAIRIEERRNSGLLTAKRAEGQRWQVVEEVATEGHRPSRCPSQLTARTRIVVGWRSACTRQHTSEVALDTRRSVRRGIGKHSSAPVAGCAVARRLPTTSRRQAGSSDTPSLTCRTTAEGLVEAVHGRLPGRRAYRLREITSALAFTASADG